jgi:hypothetical protein
VFLSTLAHPQVPEWCCRAANPAERLDRTVGSLLSADLAHLILVMPDAMSCPEYFRLRTDYEAALRRWGDVLLAQHAGLLVGDVERALERRKDAADERDAAYKRLEDHKRSCLVCREAISQYRNPYKKFKPSKS